MLHLVRGLYDEWTRTDPYRIVVVGRTGAGKSGLVASLNRAVAGRPGLPVASLRPTLGQSVVEIPLPLPLPPPLAEQVRAARASLAAARGWFAAPQARARLKLWDLGASADLPTLWPRYYPDADCLVFVVDAAVFAFLLPPAGTSPDPSASVSASVPHSQSHSHSESDAEDTWTQLGTSPASGPFCAGADRSSDTPALAATILSAPALREKPVLIAVSKIDTLPSLSAGALVPEPAPAPAPVPLEDAHDGTRLQPTAQGSALDRFEEAVRTWFADRFAHASISTTTSTEAAVEPQLPAAEAADAAACPPHSPAEPEPGPEAASTATDAAPALAKAGSASTAEAAQPPLSSPSPLPPPSPPSADALPATHSGPAAHDASKAAADLAPVSAGAAQPRPQPQLQPRPPRDDSKPGLAAVNAAAVAERYWEVVCVSGVSLYVSPVPCVRCDVRRTTRDARRVKLTRRRTAQDTDLTLSAQRGPGGPGVLSAAAGPAGRLSTGAV